jgi:hypothetical protein
VSCCCDKLVAEVGDISTVEELERLLSEAATDQRLVKT